MKKTALILFTLGLTLAMSAQSIDLSGNWKLNAEKSKLNEQFSMAPAEIIIIQGNNDLSLEKHSEFQGQAFIMNDKFTLDGKECINPGFMDTQKKSLAQWSEDGKTIKIISKIAMDDGGEMAITEVFKMDGSNLVIESASASSFGDMAETMVYDKK
jgi:hypothetical protein